MSSGSLNDPTCIQAVAAALSVWASWITTLRIPLGRVTKRYSRSSLADLRMVGDGPAPVAAAWRASSIVLRRPRTAEEPAAVPRARGTIDLR